MCTFKDITDAMFFLACGNHPVKTDCVFLRRYVLSLVAIIPATLSFLSYKLVSFLT